MLGYVNMSYAKAKTKTTLVEKTSGMGRGGEEKEMVLSCSVLNCTTIPRNKSGQTRKTSPNITKNPA